jgi:hypothetical protein
MRIDWQEDPNSTNHRGNTFLGYNAGPSVSTDTGVAHGFNNTLIGASAGFSLTTGQQNTAIGSRAGFSMVTTTQNTFIGQGAGFGVTSDNNVAIGFHAALNATTGPRNTIIVGEAWTTGDQNTGVGTTSLNALNSGSNNTTLGYRAGTAITSGSANTIMGRDAGLTLSTQSFNVVIGSEAGRSLADAQNTIIGTIAGYSMSGASNNVIIGYGAAEAGTDLTSGDNNVVIGHNAQVSGAAAAGQVVIGQGSIGTADNTATFGDRNFEGPQATTGTPKTWRVPTAIAADTITLPTCSTSADAGRLVYVDDSNSGTRAMLCVCLAGADDATYAWEDTADGTTNCVDP